MRCELAIGEKKVCVRWKLFRIVQREEKVNFFNQLGRCTDYEHKCFFPKRSGCANSIKQLNKSIISKLRSSLITGLCTCAILLQHNPPYFCFTVRHPTYPAVEALMYSTVCMCYVISGMCCTVGHILLHAPCLLS